MKITKRQLKNAIREVTEEVLVEEGLIDVASKVKDKAVEYATLIKLIKQYVNASNKANRTTSKIYKDVGSKLSSVENKAQSYIDLADAMVKTMGKAKAEKLLRSLIRG